MELKPCPFCGREADWGVDDEGFFHVGCPTWDCFGGIYENHYTFSTVEEAAEKWNRRANDV